MTGHEEVRAVAILAAALVRPGVGADDVIRIAREFEEYIRGYPDPTPR